MIVYYNTYNGEVCFKAKNGKNIYVQKDVVGQGQHLWITFPSLSFYLPKDMKWLKMRNLANSIKNSSLKILVDWEYYGEETK